VRIPIYYDDEPPQRRERRRCPVGKRWQELLRQNELFEEKEDENFNV
jgi:hypothetical protein